MTNQVTHLPTETLEDILIDRVEPLPRQKAALTEYMTRTDRDLDNYLRIARLFCFKKEVTS